MMPRGGRFSALPVLLAVLAAALPRAAVAEEACIDLGFTEALQCATCTRLDDAVDDDALVAECRQCCHDDEVKADTSGVVYATAKLRVCQ